MEEATVRSGTSSYPGGKSGAGIYQRLINLIPPHEVLIVPFAGHCGVVRNIRPAEHTIVIDRDPDVCEWWSSWSRSKTGRRLEIHHCDGIDWLRCRLGCTEYSANLASVAGSNVGRPRGRSSRSTRPVMAGDRDRVLTKSASSAEAIPRATLGSSAEAFIFCDPPYVMSERSTGRIYDFELSDVDHQRFLGTATAIDATRYRIMICGYSCSLYAPLGSWHSIDHRVPTRGGLQDERIWMNYPQPVHLHDYRYLGNCRRSRERIRRRQKNWQEQLMRMPEQERLAMIQALFFP